MSQLFMMEAALERTAPGNPLSGAIPIVDHECRQ
jgi:hypothetical protein